MIGWFRLIGFILTVLFLMLMGDKTLTLGTFLGVAIGFVLVSALLDLLAIKGK